MSDETAVFVRALELEAVGPGGGDDSEDIRVHRVTASRADDWLAARARAGLAVDPKIFAALYWGPPRPG